MTIKTTGLEWKAFYTEAQYWPEGHWHEDEVITINGADVSEEDVDLSQVQDKDLMTVAGGCVFTNKGEEVASLESWFRKWRKAQTTVTIIMEVPKTELENLKSAAKLVRGVRII